MTPLDGELGSIVARHDRLPVVANARRSFRTRAVFWTSQVAKYSIRLSLTSIFVNRLVRSRSAVRFLARHQIWPRAADLARLNDRDFAVLVRTSGLERDTRLALEQEDEAQRGESAQGVTRIQDAEAEPQPGRPHAT